MNLYCNISDEAFFDKVTGETFLPGQDLWIRDEVQPDYLLRECKVREEVEKVKWVKTDHLLKDPRLVVVRETVYKEPPEVPKEFITNKDGKLIPNLAYDSKITHYHGTIEEVVVNDEKAVEAIKAAYLASLEVKP